MEKKNPTESPFVFPYPVIPRFRLGIGRRIERRAEGEEEEETGEEAFSIHASVKVDDNVDGRDEDFGRDENDDYGQ